MSLHETITMVAEEIAEALYTQEITEMPELNWVAYALHLEHSEVEKDFILDALQSTVNESYNNLVEI